MGRTVNHARNLATFGAVALVLAIAASLFLRNAAPRAVAAPAREAPLAQADAGAVVEGWGRIITVTSQWLVVQNQAGQQFQIAFDQVDLFAIRWPTTLDRLSPSSLVEATGVSPSSDRVLTSRVDVYEGAARALVAPGVLLISPTGEVSRPIDFLFNPEVYGGAFPGMEGPIHSGATGGPKLTHVVGPIVNRAPLQVGVGGNNAMAIFPAGEDFQMTQITEGTSAMLKPGDLVYFLATRATPLTLELRQLVVNKSVFIDQMRP